MRITDKHIARIAKSILDELKSQKVIEFKAKEEDAFSRACDIIKADFEREKDLDQEVHDMMDDLEKQNPGGFQRYKMFPMLKKKLAEQKGIVL